MTTPEDKKPLDHAVPEKLTPEHWLDHWYIDKLISDDAYRFRYDMIGTPAQRDDQLTALDRIRHFRAAINVGIYPDTHTLAALAAFFGKYLRAADEGEGITLEAAFGLPPSRQRVGNAAQRAAADEARDNRSWEMHDYIARTGASQLAAAEAVQKALDIDTPDCETMVRDYSQWKRIFELPTDDADWR